MSKAHDMADAILELAVEKDFDPPHLIKACTYVLGYLIANFMPEEDLEGVTRMVGKVIEEETPWQRANPPASLH
jgi:hypothetical protein